MAPRKRSHAAVDVFIAAQWLRENAELESLMAPLYSILAAGLAAL